MYRVGSIASTYSMYVHGGALESVCRPIPVVYMYCTVLVSAREGPKCLQYIFTLTTVVYRTFQAVQILYFMHCT
jgi:hypothetical protein